MVPQDLPLALLCVHFLPEINPGKTKKYDFVMENLLMHFHALKDVLEAFVEWLPC